MAFNLHGNDKETEKKLSRILIKKIIIMSTTVIVLAVVVVIAIYFISVYNRLVGLRNNR